MIFVNVDKNLINIKSWQHGYKYKPIFYNICQFYYSKLLRDCQDFLVCTKLNVD